MLGIVLSIAAPAFKYRDPIQRVAVACEPVPEINTHPAGRQRAPILIQRHRHAAHRPPRNESVKIVGSLGTKRALRSAF
jgi:hypothetical protein